MAVIWGDIRKHIQSDGKFNITRIEIYQVISARGRNVVQQFLGQIAVRVNDAHSMTESNVLDDQIPQERRLAGAGFSDDVDVVALVLDRYAKAPGIAPALAFPNDDAWLVIHGSKTSRHSFHEESPACLNSFYVESTFTPAECFGTRRRGNGD